MTAALDSTWEPAIATDSDDAIDELGPGGIPYYKPSLNDHTPRLSFPKSQFLLSVTIQNLMLKHLLTHILFVTLTFSKKVLHTKKAQKRLNSFFNLLRKRYGSYLWVLGWHASDGIHYHLLIPVAFDCHACTDLSAWSSPLGTSTAAIDREQRNAMNPLLRGESKWWHDNAPKYGFGRLQVAPIYSNGEAIRKYFLKQASPVAHALVGVRNVRFWSCSKNLRCGTLRFSWNSPRATLFRAILQEWATARGCTCWDDLKDCLGDRWFRSFRDYLHVLEKASCAEEALASEGTSEAEIRAAGSRVHLEAKRQAKAEGWAAGPTAAERRELKDSETHAAPVRRSEILHPAVPALVPL